MDKYSHSPSYSAAAMLMGVAIGALVSFSLNDLTLYQFSPEFFFFVLLPPIIFEAGYSLEKKSFFENLGTIVLFAIVGTIISTFVVGLLTFYFAKKGFIHGISTTNPMEALLFGSLISAVDPVATLSIMNNPELRCNKLLYSLVFGEVSQSKQKSLFKVELVEKRLTCIYHGWTYVIDTSKECSE